MVAVWLYAADGRALYYVETPLPMAPVLAYNGLIFQWSATAQRYVQQQLPTPVPPVPANVAQHGTPPAEKHHYPV